jgi:L-threonylcarbamoyladenylate synthase
VPRWLTGGQRRLAVRVTAHPVARALCRGFGGPLVSTSANRTGRAPARSAAAVRLVFGAALDAVVVGPVGGAARPSPIRDALTGVWLRR